MLEVVQIIRSQAGLHYRLMPLLRIGAAAIFGTPDSIKDRSSPPPMSCSQTLRKGVRQPKPSDSKILMRQARAYGVALPAGDAQVKLRI
jgi:hypothetical protein